MQTGDAMLLRAYKREMLCFSEQTNGGCYASQNKQMGDDMLLRTKQRGDAIHLGENQPGMLYFSEQNKRGCYSSESIQTEDAIFLRTKQTEG
jgi:hypothetical protein